MTPPVRIGVLGCADIARRRMLPAMAASADTVPAAVASRDPEKAEATARPFGARPVHGYEELLARDDIDAVYVPLPAALHERWAEEALRAGKHVLAEKPLTLDPAATRRLLALARADGLVLMENVMFVHHPQHERVRELVACGAIGELRFLDAEFAIPSLSSQDIRLRPELGGGALWDVGVYPVRAALHLLDEDPRLVGAALVRSPGDQVATGGSALLRTDSGVLARLAFGMRHAYRNSYTLWGSEGRITVDRVFTPPADHRPVVRLERAGGSEEFVLEAADQATATLRAFAHAVRTGHHVDTDAPLRQALLLDAIRRQAD
ncbi:Gfo/Idh/MocA family protein [Streptomyces virginiae]|uniref:Gfo/Idh/MocA family protein n=1 Tax=Streptomyces virginiae TaxID=1961 RepID=UPI00224DEC54|nr:Gfo/Idh/MocA family oxidoreductase [Streptomyces virginiae]MCX4957483.1 Gfo/Idh/MocA family oxidoreductase [Streptomyces virginiae]MCX5176225.1 Gfo/Idh/MocA family oxidoreductase [Streptomyces virginiae]